MLCGDIHPNPGPLQSYNFKVEQWNMRSGVDRALLEELISHLEKNDIKVCLLQETWRKAGDLPMAFANYNCYEHLRNSTDRGGGLAILVHKSLKSQAADSSSQVKKDTTPICEYLNVYVRSQIGCWLRFSCVYFPKGSLFSQQWMDTIVPAGLTLPPSLAEDDSNLNSHSNEVEATIVCGDFNVHDPRICARYRPSNQLPMGADLVSWCDQNSHVIANSPTEFTRKANHESHQFSSPDVTLSKGVEITDWKTVDPPFSQFSDHFPIQFEVNIDPSSPIVADATVTHSRRPLFAWKKANWAKYKKILLQSTSRKSRALAGYKHMSINRQNRWFNDRLRVATNRSVPRSNKVSNTQTRETQTMKETEESAEYVKIYNEFVLLRQQRKELISSDLYSDPKNKLNGKVLTISKALTKTAERLRSLKRAALHELFKKKVDNLHGSNSASWKLIKNQSKQDPVDRIKNLKEKRKQKQDSSSTSAADPNKTKHTKQQQQQQQQNSSSNNNSNNNSESKSNVVQDSATVASPPTSNKTAQQHQQQSSKKKRGIPTKLETAAKKVAAEAAIAVEAAEVEKRQKAAEAHAQAAEAPKPAPPTYYEPGKKPKPVCPPCVRPADDLSPIARAGRFCHTYSEVSTRDKSSSPPLSKFLLKESWKQSDAQKNAKDADQRHKSLRHKLVDVAELDHAIRMTPTGRASGEDEIHAESLRHLPNCARATLLALINKTFARGKVPDRWKTQLIIPLPKPGKDPKILGSYRPVSLTSVLCKLTERIVANRLAFYLDKCLTDRQSGFRPGRRTADQLAHAFAFVEKARAKRPDNKIAAVLVDFSRAFDKVDHRILIDIMEKCKFPRYIILWILDFLSGRKGRVMVGSTKSKWRNFTCGVPQGTVLGPLLFLIYINELAQALDDKGIDFGFFADDLTLFLDDADPAKLTSRINEALEIINSWSKAHYMKVAPEKTKYMVFNAQRQPPQQKKKTKNSAAAAAPSSSAPADSPSSDYKLDVLFDGKKVDHDEAPTLLGFRFGPNNDATEHVAYLIKEDRARLNQLRCVLGSSWGPSASAARTFYTGYCLGKLAYATESWMHLPSNDEFEKLEVLHRKAARMITGLHPSASNITSLNEARMMPLKDIATMRSFKYMIHCLGSDGLRREDALDLFADESHPARVLLRKVAEQNKLDISTNPQDLDDGVLQYTRLVDSPCSSTTASSSSAVDETTPPTTIEEEPPPPSSSCSPPSAQEQSSPTQYSMVKAPLQKSFAEFYEDTAAVGAVSRLCRVFTHSFVRHPSDASDEVKREATEATLKKRIRYPLYRAWTDGSAQLSKGKSGGAAFVERRNDTPNADGTYDYTPISKVGVPSGPLACSMTAESFAMRTCVSAMIDIIEKDHAKQQHTKLFDEKFAKTRLPLVGELLRDRIRTISFAAKDVEYDDIKKKMQWCPDSPIDAQMLRLPNRIRRHADKVARTICFGSSATAQQWREALRFDPLLEKNPCLVSPPVRVGGTRLERPHEADDDIDNLENYLGTTDKKRTHADILPPACTDPQVLLSFARTFFARRSKLDDGSITADPMSSRPTVAFLSDSQSLLQALKSGPFRNDDVVIADIWRSLLRLTKYARVKMQHVRSHCGILGNEIVDKLADAAADLKQSGVPLQPRDIAAAAKKILKDKNKANANASNTKRQQLLGEEKPQNLKLTQNLPRHVERTLTQIRSGFHPQIGSFNRILNNRPDACRWCCPEVHAKHEKEVAAIKYGLTGIISDSYAGTIARTARFHDDSANICSYCSKSFDTKRNLAYHLFSAKRKGNKPCEKAPKRKFYQVCKSLNYEPRGKYKAIIDQELLDEKNNNRSSSNNNNNGENAETSNNNNNNNKKKASKKNVALSSSSPISTEDDATITATKGRKTSGPNAVLIKRLPGSGKIDFNKIPRNDEGKINFKNGLGRAVNKQLRSIISAAATDDKKKTDIVVEKTKLVEAALEKLKEFVEIKNQTEAEIQTLSTEIVEQSNAVTEKGKYLQYTSQAAANAQQEANDAERKVYELNVKVSEQQKEVAEKSKRPAAAVHAGIDNSRAKKAKTDDVGVENTNNNSSDDNDRKEEAILMQQQQTTTTRSIAKMKMPSRREIAAERKKIKEANQELENSKELKQTALVGKDEAESNLLRARRIVQERRKQQAQLQQQKMEVSSRVQQTIQQHEQQRQELEEAHEDKQRNQQHKNLHEQMLKDQQNVKRVIDTASSKKSTERKQTVVDYDENETTKVVTNCHDGNNDNNKSHDNIEILDNNEDSSINGSKINTTNNNSNTNILTDSLIDDNDVESVASSNDADSSADSDEVNNNNNNINLKKNRDDVLCPSEQQDLFLLDFKLDFENSLRQVVPQHAFEQPNDAVEHSNNSFFGSASERRDLLDNTTHAKEKSALLSLQTVIANAAVGMMISEDYPEVTSSPDLPVPELLQMVAEKVLEDAESNIKYLVTSLQLQQFKEATSKILMVDLPLDILYSSLTASSVSRNLRYSALTHSNDDCTCDNCNNKNNNIGDISNNNNSNNKDDESSGNDKNGGGGSGSSSSGGEGNGSKVCNFKNSSSPCFSATTNSNNNNKILSAFYNLIQDEIIALRSDYPVNDVYSAVKHAHKQEYNKITDSLQKSFEEKVQSRHLRRLARRSHAEAPLGPCLQGIHNSSLKILKPTAPTPAQASSTPYVALSSTTISSSRPKNSIVNNNNITTTNIASNDVDELQQNLNNNKNSDTNILKCDLCSFLPRTRTELGDHHKQCHSQEKQNAQSLAQQQEQDKLINNIIKHVNSDNNKARSKTTKNSRKQKQQQQKEEIDSDMELLLAPTVFDNDNYTTPTDQENEQDSAEDNNNNNIHHIRPILLDDEDDERIVEQLVNIYNNDNHDPEQQQQQQQVEVINDNSSFILVYPESLLAQDYYYNRHKGSLTNFINNTNNEHPKETIPHLFHECTGTQVLRKDFGIDNIDMKKNKKEVAKLLSQQKGHDFFTQLLKSLHPDNGMSLMTENDVTTTTTNTSNNGSDSLMQGNVVNTKNNTAEENTSNNQDNLANIEQTIPNIVPTSNNDGNSLKTTVAINNNAAPQNNNRQFRRNTAGTSNIGRRLRVLDENGHSGD